MTHSLPRRDFLLGSAATLAAADALWSADAAEPFPIIDTHQHLWDLGQFRLPWLKDAAPLAKNHVMEDYLRAAGELARSKLGPAKVVKAVYMEVDVAPEQQQAEADFVASVCKSGKTPMVAAVVSGRPASDGFAAYVRPFRGDRYIKGIRQVLHGGSTPAGFCLDSKFIRGIRLLGELGLSFDLCMRNPELPDAAKLVDACPDTRFILDHCGNADLKAKDHSAWKKDMAEIAKRKNVVGKVSGFIASAPGGKWRLEELAPIINHTLEVFGPDRVMWAGDWPVCTLAASLAEWIDAVRAVVRERPAVEQRKLFHDNAAKFYGIA